MKKALILAGFSIIGIVLVSGCFEKISESSEEIAHNYTIYNYSTPGFEINQTQAAEVWGKVNFSDDARFVTQEKNYSVTVFVQRYAKGPLDNSIYGGSTAEWIAVVSSIPEKTEDVKIAVFRLDYRTFGFKRSYYFSYPTVKEFTLQQSIAVMEEELKKESAVSQSINENAVVQQDGNYIYVYQSPDSGGEIYLFNWDKVPWDHNGVNGFLYSLGFSAITKFEKSDNNRTIKAFSIGKSVSLRLNYEKNRTYMELDNSSTAELTARMENGSLNIYGATADTGAIIIFNKYAGKTIFHATKAVMHAKPVRGVSGKLIVPGEEVNGTSLLPVIETRLESISSPAYRGTSTIAKLSFVMHNNISNESRVYVEYTKEMLHTNGSLESEPAGFDFYLSDRSLIPQKKLVVFPDGVNEQQKVYSNLTIKTAPEADEGDYFITITLKYKGLVIGRNVLSFRIGKGRKKLTPGGKSATEGTWNIGYSADQPPPLNDIEKAELTAVALNDPYLQSKRYALIGVTSEYLDLENYSGFFAVATVDVGDPDYPGEIIRYIIDREEKKIIGSAATPRKALGYLRGQAFDEANNNFIKRWDAGNFPGLWFDAETNTSTETLVIDQSLLDSSHRIIEKHNLIYTTNVIPLKYQVYARINITPRNTDGFYQAAGWMGEKHVYLQEDRLAMIILEQNASDVKTLGVMESWKMGDGYSIIANSIDAKAATRQAWFSLLKGTTKLSDEVVLPGGAYEASIMCYHLNNDSVPIFVTYFHQVYVSPYSDAADLKYTWLRSQKATDIKEGNTFGIMEVTYVDNGKIELRNREPVDLAPGNIISLMGNISIQVGSSDTGLSFYPFRVRKP